MRHIPIFLFFASAVAACAPEPTYDILIRGGMLYDGTGDPPRREDVGIRDGRIASIGELSDAVADVELDASGRAVAPGFIDLHTHSDIPLLVDGTAESMVHQGVTLNVLGESRSVGPLEGEVLEAYRTQAKRRYDFDVHWTSVAEYFERLERQGVSINVATSVAPEQVKHVVVGYEARAATDDELARMKELVAQAMREGAVGLSTAWEGGGYEYPEEILAMAKVAAEHGGYYSTHVGSEGYQLEEEIDKAIRVADEADLPVHILHFKIRGRKLWGQLDPAIDQIEQARARGLDVTANQYPYTAMQHPWGALFPTWAKEGPDKILEVLSVPENREKLKKDPVFIQYVEEHGGFEGVVASRFNHPDKKELEGKTIAEIAEIRGDADPADTCFDLILEEGGFVPGVHHNMSEEDVQRIMKLPWVAIASDGTALRPDGVLGEGIPHPRSYGTAVRVLGKYVREEDVLTLPDAVRKMSGFPAEILGIDDRGLLRVGYWADVVVFDPDRVQDRATFEEPEQYPVGIEHVLVNGVRVIDGGEHTGARPGKVILGTGYRARATSDD